jgi:hypothetical protein
MARAENLAFTASVVTIGVTAARLVDSLSGIGVEILRACFVVGDWIGLMQTMNQTRTFSARKGPA